jgi:hypothetical protein
MKPLDDTTLEVIAETICGGGGGGGAVPYTAPGPYRSKSEIHTFFGRANVKPSGMSSTRKWFVLESLQNLNREAGGALVSPGIEHVLLRLSTPQEYRGDMPTTQAVIDHLNGVLKLEGFGDSPRWHPAEAARGSSRRAAAEAKRPST